MLRPKHIPFPFFLLLVVLNIPVNSFSQQAWCGTEWLDPLIAQKAPADRMARERVQAYIDHVRHQKQSEPIVFPVVVHIIHDNGDGDISDEQVADGLRVINEDFNRLNPDTTDTRDTFRLFAGNPRMTFKLATVDPEGNATTGILRVNSPLIPHPEPVDSAFDNVKYLSHWPSDQYYNIWLVRDIVGSTLGYAQYPGTAFTYGGPWKTWGIIVRSDQWGTIGSSQVDGRTGTHEIGHTLGLYHPFLSYSTDCGTACDTTGDEVCDTPPCRPTSDCWLPANTCHNDTSGPSPYTTDMPDQLENFMAYNTCQNMFSIGQQERMLGYIAAFDTIQELISTANLVKTGVYEAPASVRKDPSHDPGIQIFPNPVKRGNVLRISTNGIPGEISIRLMNLAGAIQTGINNDPGEKTLFIDDHLPAGIYFLTVQWRDGIQTRKLVILP